METAGVLKHLIRSESPYPFFRKLYNFFYWQLFAKKSTAAFVFKLPDGASMSLQPGEHGASGYYYVGYPDYAEMLFLKHNLTKGDLFVDVGANSGGWSLTALGMGAVVIAFEPIPATFERLSRNILLNNTNGIRAYNVGLSETHGMLTFTTDKDAGNKIVTEAADGNNQLIAVKPLDEFLAAENPVIIKIDVEGHELNVIKGATNTLKKKSLKALIIETFRWANYDTADLKEMEAILRLNGFIPVHYQPATKLATPLGDNEGDQNTIYLRK